MSDPVTGATRAERPDYTRDEALAVAEVGSLRQLVADAFTDQIDADRLRTCLVSIRKDHVQCRVGDRGDDSRCAQCDAIDAALRQRFLLATSPASPAPAALAEVLKEIAKEWRARSKRIFAEATDHNDRVMRLIASTERGVCASELLAALASAPEALSARCEAAEAENRQWQTWGIVEIAVRNPNVASYVEHWEGRALTAEARVRALEEEKEPPEKLNGQQIRKGTGDALKDVVWAAEALDYWLSGDVPSTMPKTPAWTDSRLMLRFCERALRVAKNEITQLRRRKLSAAPAKAATEEEK